MELEPMLPASVNMGKLTRAEHISICRTRFTFYLNFALRFQNQNDSCKANSLIENVCIHLKVIALDGT